MKDTLYKIHVRGELQETLFQILSNTVSLISFGYTHGKDMSFIYGSIMI